MHPGVYSEPSAETFRSFLEKWLEHKGTQVRQRTSEIYARTIRLHIEPELGHIELGKLKPQHLRVFYVSLLSKELSNRYVAQIHSLIHDALQIAVKWELIPRNVAESVDAPRPENKKFTVWTLEETQRFLAAAHGHRFYIAFLLAITTGMRQGEILGLIWSDIDFIRKQLTIQRTASQYGGKMRYSDSKSERGKRMIALPQETVEAWPSRTSSEGFWEIAIFLEENSVICN